MLRRLVSLVLRAIKFPDMSQLVAMPVMIRGCSSYRPMSVTKC